MSDPQYTPDDVLILNDTTEIAQGRRHIHNITVRRLRDAEWNAAIEAAARHVERTWQGGEAIARTIRALKRPDAG